MYLSESNLLFLTVHGLVFPQFEINFYVTLSKAQGWLERVVLEEKKDSQEMPKIIMFLAFCQNWSQFHQAEALKNPVFGLKTRKKALQNMKLLGNNFGFFLHVF